MSTIPKRELSDTEETLPRRVSRRKDDEMDDAEVKQQKRTMEELVTCDLRSNNERTIERAMNQLQQIVHDRDDRRLEKKQNEFFSLGSHAIVVRVMMENPDHTNIQSFGLRVLMGAMHRNNEMRSAVVKVKGMHVVIAAMKTRSSCRDVQYFGLKALKVSRLGIFKAITSCSHSSPFLSSEHVLLGR